MKPRDNSEDRARSGEDESPFGRRPASGLDQTLPLGTPRPSAVQTPGPGSERNPERVRAAYKQTILLGTREHPLGLREPALSGPWGPSVAAETRAALEAPAPVTPALLPASRSFSEAVPDSVTLRGSFVRAVGPPTVPPPRRSRRSGVAWESAALTASGPERAAAEPSTSTEGDQHEAFALDRPRLSAVDVPAQTSTAESAVVSRGSWPELGQGSRTGSVMLPPPPGVGDYEPASDPDSAPPPPRVPSRSLAAPSEFGAASPVSSRSVSSRSGANSSVAQRSDALDELPQLNPFAGFEAPRESWGRRSAIVFTLALALVGLCALVALALGFLGKRGW
jgi:hypothetical protein